MIEIESPSPNHEGNVYFFNGDGFKLRLKVYPEDIAERNIVGYYPYEGMFMMPVTARDLNPENDPKKKRVLDPCKRYCEIGPGFSGIFTNLAFPLRVRPTIIDPVPYDKFLYLFEEAIFNLRDNEEVRNLLGIRTLEDYQRDLDKMRQNCELYLDKSQVIRYQMRFREALRRHPELLGSFDEAPFFQFSSEMYDIWDIKPNEDSHLDLIEKCIR